MIFQKPKNLHPKPYTLNPNSGFTLIEVLVASVILSITVFGILRLSSNSSNQITLLEKNATKYDILNSSKSCLENFGYDNLVNLTSTTSLNFGGDNNGCFTGVYNSDLTFSGIELVSYYEDKKVGSDIFRSYFTTSTGSDFVLINNFVSDSKNEINLEYKIKK